MDPTAPTAKREASGPVRESKRARGDSVSNALLLKQQRDALESTKDIRISTEAMSDVSKRGYVEKLKSTAKLTYDLVEGETPPCQLRWLQKNMAIKVLHATYTDLAQLEHYGSQSAESMVTKLVVMPCGSGKTMMAQVLILVASACRALVLSEKDSANVAKMVPSESGPSRVLADRVLLLSHNETGCDVLDGAMRSSFTSLQKRCKIVRVTTQTVNENVTKKSSTMDKDDAAKKMMSEMANADVVVSTYSALQCGFGADLNGGSQPKAIRGKLVSLLKTGMFGTVIMDEAHSGVSHELNKVWVQVKMKLKEAKKPPVILYGLTATPYHEGQSCDQNTVGDTGCAKGGGDAQSPDGAGDVGDAGKPDEDAVAAQAEDEDDTAAFNTLFGRGDGKPVDKLSITYKDAAAGMEFGTKESKLFKSGEPVVCSASLVAVSCELSNKEKQDRVRYDSMRQALHAHSRDRLCDEKKRTTIVNRLAEVAEKLMHGGSSDLVAEARDLMVTELRGGFAAEVLGATDSEEAEARVAETAETAAEAAEAAGVERNVDGIKLLDAVIDRAKEVARQVVDQPLKDHKGSKSKTSSLERLFAANMKNRKKLPDTLMRMCVRIVETNRVFGITTVIFCRNVSIAHAVQRSIGPGYLFVDGKVKADSRESALAELDSGVADGMVCTPCAAQSWSINHVGAIIYLDGHGGRQTAMQCFGRGTRVNLRNPDKHLVVYDLHALETSDDALDAPTSTPLENVSEFDRTKAMDRRLEAYTNDGFEPKDLRSSLVGTHDATYVRDSPGETPVYDQLGRWLDVNVSILKECHVMSAQYGYVRTVRAALNGVCDEYIGFESQDRRQVLTPEDRELREMFTTLREVNGFADHAAAQMKRQLQAVVKLTTKTMRMRGRSMAPGDGVSENPSRSERLSPNEACEQLLSTYLDWADILKKEEPGKWSGLSRPAGNVSASDVAVWLMDSATRMTKGWARRSERLVAQLDDRMETVAVSMGGIIEWCAKLKTDDEASVESVDDKVFVRTMPASTLMTLMEELQRLKVTGVVESLTDEFETHQKSLESEQNVSWNTVRNFTSFAKECWLRKSEEFVSHCRGEKFVSVHAAVERQEIETMVHLDTELMQTANTKTAQTVEEQKRRADLMNRLKHRTKPTTWSTSAIAREQRARTFASMVDELELNRTSFETAWDLLVEAGSPSVAGTGA
jgi:superfamily II DNA or RNA helicase